MGPNAIAPGQRRGPLVVQLNTAVAWELRFGDGVSCRVVNVRSNRHQIRPIRITLVKVKLHVGGTAKVCGCKVLPAIIVPARNRELVVYQGGVEIVGATDYEAVNSLVRTADILAVRHVTRIIEGGYSPSVRDN